MLNELVTFFNGHGVGLVPKSRTTLEKIVGDCADMGEFAEQLCQNVRIVVPHV